MFLRFFSLAGLLFILFSACSSSDPESQCITALDCGPEQICVDGTCIDKGTGDTGTHDDTSDTGDTADLDENPDTSDTGDSGMPDDPGDTGDTKADEDAPSEDPCDPNPCTDVALSDGTCTAEGESYSCGCVSGYHWNETLCEDLDECSDELLNNCSEFAQCTNITGDFICECLENYSGNGVECTADTKQVSCANTLPDNASWDASNPEGLLTQTWTGSDWAPEADECLWNCNSGYVKNNEKTACINGRSVPCTNIPSNAQGAGANSDGFMIQTFSAELGWTPSPDTCEWACQTDYTKNDTGDACINSKLVQCSPNNIADSTDTSAAVIINYTTSGGWQTPVKCAWSCNTDFEKNGDSCINSKQLQCNTDNSNPVNSTDIIANVTVSYTTAGGWTAPALCGWNCNTTYKQSGGICIIACGEGNIDAGEACDYGVGNVAPGYNTAKTCNTGCQWNTYCGDGTVNGGETCDGSDFAGKSCQTEGFGSGTLNCESNCSSISTVNCINCAPGWTLMNFGSPRCIKYFSDSRNASSAAAYCNTFSSGRLVTILNSSENTFIKNIISANSWIGLADATEIGQISALVNVGSGYNSPANPYWLGAYGGQITGNTSSNYNYFKFTTKEAKMYTFALYNLSSDLDLFLYDANCSSLLGSLTETGSELGYSDLSAGTTYCVKIGYNNNSSPYILAINYSSDEYQYFSWLSGSLYNYHNWNNGEPNSSDEFCTQIYTSGLWNDLDCSDSLPYVCERNTGSY